MGNVAGLDELIHDNNYEIEETADLSGVESVLHVAALLLEDKFGQGIAMTNFGIVRLQSDYFN